MVLYSSAVVICKMAATHVVKCWKFCSVSDVSRVNSWPTLLSNQNLYKLTRTRVCRLFCSVISSSSRCSDENKSVISCRTASSQKVQKKVLLDEVTVEYYRGLPQITVPLPSRKEKCRFTLRPVSNTVGDFINMLCTEDRGIDHVSISTPKGIRIASSNTIEALMEDDFRLIINDICYYVKTPKQEKLSPEEIERLSDVKNLIHQLYEALNVEEHQIKKERDLCVRLEELKMKLEPMEKKKNELHIAAERQTNVLTWVGLGLMSVQFGILARLTWWEYSWDIMEPVTYFVTYGTAMAAYAYYVLTKQEYILPDVKDRQYLITMHKKAKKIGLDLEKYNLIKEEIYGIEYDLKRLRDPLQVHLPPHHLADSLKKSSNPFAKAFSIFQKNSKENKSTSSQSEPAVRDS